MATTATKKKVTKTKEPKKVKTPAKAKASAVSRAKKSKPETMEETSVKAVEAAPVEVVEQAAIAPATIGSGSFIRSLGRRKTAIARVRLVPSGKGVFVVNGNPHLNGKCLRDNFFHTGSQRGVIRINRFHPIQSQISLPQVKVLYQRAFGLQRVQYPVEDRPVIGNIGLN